MKRLLPVLLSLLLTNAAFTQERQINPVVFILDEASGREHRLFDQELWTRAGVESEGALQETLLSSAPDAIELAQIAAMKKGAAPNIILLSTINTRDKNSREFHKSVAQLEDVLGYKDDPELWPRMLDLPMCKLYQQRPNDGDTVPVSILLVLDNPNARLVCYRLIMAHYAGKPDESGDLVAPIYVDNRAVTSQVSMPPIKVHSAFLALKGSRDAKGRYQERSSNVYAPDEEIFLRAYLDHVGRKLAGTTSGTYQIDMSLEVRDEIGNVISKAALHSFKGASTLIFPMDATYFYNDITGGVSLKESGNYNIAFLFKDASRPELPAAEAVFSITIE